MSGDAQPSSLARKNISVGCTSFPTSVCRLVKDLKGSTSTAKSEAAAATLGQLLSVYLDSPRRRSNGNGSVSIGGNNFESCCQAALHSIWETIATVEPELGRRVLRCTRISTVLAHAPNHIHHAALRSYITDKNSLVLSRQLHGVEISVLVAILANFSHLGRLDMSQNALTEEDIPEIAEVLQGFSALYHLDLSANSICEDGAESLSEALVEMPKLRHLVLNSTLLEDEGVAFISRALAAPLDVRHLSLAKCGISADGAASLSQALRSLPKLSHLDLQGNDIQGDGISSICEGLITSRLTYLDVSDNSLGSEGIQAMAAAIPQMPAINLHHLGLSSNGLEAQDAPDVAAVLQAAAHSLSTVSIADNDFQDEGLNQLHTTIQTIVNLRHLSIAGNEATAKGFAQQAPSYSHLPKLRHLDASYQPVLEGGSVKLFAAGMQHITGLHTLMLISVGLDAFGAQALAGALPQMTHLSSLHLSHNRLSGDGATAIMQAIEGMPSLTHVSLGYTELGPRCIPALGPALQTATHLHFLDLRYNALRVQGTLALVHHLKHISSLKSVVLEGNGVEEPEDVQAVEKSLRGVRVWLNVGARIA